MINEEHSSLSEFESDAEALANAQAEISDQEFALAKADFVRSAARAQKGTSKKAIALQLLGNLAKAAALVLCIVGLGYASKYTLQPEIVVASRLDDFSAVVISNLTNRVVPGVEVYRVGLNNDPDGNELVGVTDPNGMVYLATPAEMEFAQFNFVYYGEHVGQVDLGENNSNTRGMFKVWVNIKSQELYKRIPVHLEPGQEHGFDSFTVELSENAGGSWDGFLVINKAWPAIFNYGDVIDGIVSVEGTPSEHLTVSLTLPETHIADRHTNYKLVSHNAVYEHSKPGWKARFHRGWYNTGNPPMASLPAEEFNVAKEKEKSLMQWCPRINSLYVILRNPPNDGEVSACFRQVMSQTGLVYESRNLEFINQEHPHIWLYEWLYHPPDGASPYYFPEYFHKSHHYLNLEASMGPRGALDAGYKWPPMIVKDELRLLPGDFSVNRYDFTGCDPVEFPRVKADYTEPAGTYRLEIEKGEVGKISRITLKGQLNRLAKPAQWDTDTDLVFDSFGNQIELLIPSYGSYHVSAQLLEKNGNIVLLKTKLNFNSKDVVGYLPGLVTDYPVVKGLNSPTEKMSSLWTMSSYSTSNLQAHSYSIGNYAGPVMYVDPPEDFRGVPLKEARLTAFISPRSGDYETLPIAMVFEPVIKTDGLEYPFKQDTSFSPFLSKISSLSAHSMSWMVRRALNKHQSNCNNNCATELMEARKHHTLFPDVFERYIGFDIFDLPSEKELLIRFEEFQNSPTYNVYYATEEHQEIVMTLPLPDCEFGNDTGFYVGIHLHTLNQLLTAQWEVHSGKEYPTRVELETLDGRVYTQYFDYSRDY